MKKHIQPSQPPLCQLVGCAAIAAAASPDHASAVLAGSAPSARWYLPFFFGNAPTAHLNDKVVWPSPGNLLHDLGFSMEIDQPTSDVLFLVEE